MIITITTDELGAYQRAIELAKKQIAELRAENAELKRAAEQNGALIAASVKKESK